MRKRYKVKFKKGESEHMFHGIALHFNPAIKRAMQMYGSEMKTEMYGDAEEGVIVGPIMIPDMPIPRNHDGEIVEYEFDAESIKNAMFDMTTGGHFNKFNINHEDRTYGVNITEFWQKEGEEDKSSAYGYGDLPVGTAFIKAHVDDEEVKQLIRDGVLKGFSVELDHGIQPVNQYEAIMTPEEIEAEVQKRVQEAQEKAEAEAKIAAQVEERLEAARKEAEAAAQAEAEAKKKAEEEAAAAEAKAKEEEEKQKEEEAKRKAEEEAEAKRKEEEEEAERQRVLDEQNGGGKGDDDDKDEDDPRKQIVPRLGTDEYVIWEQKMRGVYVEPKED